VTHRLAPGWRIASLAAIIGLLGSGMAGLALTTVSSPAGPGSSPIGQRLSFGDRPLRLEPHPPPLPPALAAGTSEGLRLLSEAAAACQDTAYRGSQVLRWWGQDETSASAVDVWHQPGRMTQAQAAGARPGAAPRSGAAGDQDPGEVLGLSARLLALLQVNYLVVYAGRGSADQRRALVVEMWRPDGGLAARFWLDAATKLPLRRELFDSSGHLVSDDAFTSLELGDPEPGGGQAVAARWPAHLDQAGLAALRARGWELPGELPGNLSLLTASQTQARSGPVVSLSYSDGLAVVSVFVQRGELAHAPPGWRPVTLHGRTVYSVNPEDRTFAWSSGGFVYTLVADAPLETVSQVVAALPGVSTPGFWQRMARGLHRIFSWINPLG
jgi:sigma-E factor negative regulatory protein RseB